jgi:hypothetical protein
VKICFKTVFGDFFADASQWAGKLVRYDMFWGALAFCSGSGARLRAVAVYFQSDKSACRPECCITVSIR